VLVEFKIAIIHVGGVNFILMPRVRLMAYESKGPKVHT